MRQFSIIIPIVGPCTYFEDTLASVLRYRPENSQVIVVHNSSYVDSYDLSKEVEFLQSPGNDTLIRCWNAALSHATGQYLFFLRPGIEIGENWDEHVKDLMANPVVASITPNIHVPGKGLKLRTVNGIRVTDHGTRLLVEGHSTRTPTVIGPTSHAAVYRTEAIGWLPSIDDNIDDVYLDVEIALGLEAAGFKTTTAAEWTLQCNDTKLISESMKPHGCSASRALTRFANHFSAWPFPIMADLASSFLGQSWRIQHGIQRLAAKKYVETDRRAYQQLQSNRQARLNLEASQKQRATPVQMRRAA